MNDLMRKQGREQVLVSIVTPSYNQGQFIEETILSVKNQSYPYIEHIIVDGGSTDDTLEILRKYEGAYDMRWVSEPDQGQADAVNKGFRMARGRIVGWLNSDDVYFYADTVNKIVKAFERHPQTSVIYGDNAEINKDNLILRIQPRMPFSYALLKRYNLINQPAVFLRSEVVDEIRLDVNLHFALDYDLWLRICAKCMCLHVSEILAAARYHQASKIAVYGAKLRQEDLEIRARYLSQPPGSLKNELLRNGTRFAMWILRLLATYRARNINLTECAFGARLDSHINLARRQVFNGYRNSFIY